MKQITQLPFCKHLDNENQQVQERSPSSSNPHQIQREIEEIRQITE